MNDMLNIELVNDNLKKFDHSKMDVKNISWKAFTHGQLENSTPIWFTSKSPKATRG